LPWVTSRYVAISGDTGVLQEPVPFLEGPALKLGEHEAMFQPAVSIEAVTLWDHCRRAIELALTRLSPRGLPLIGSCDWNDGLSEVGIQGRGESVWLAWFLIDVLNEATVIEERADRTRAQSWRQAARNLAETIERHAWDGEWYVRAFFDDGSPLGSSKNLEARIDSLAQSWAVLSGAANPERAAIAMASATRELVKSPEGVILLFTPPFDHSTPNPGYIQGYPPGVRENGGQYTHGSLWLAQAQARLNDGDGAVALLQIMNPVERSRSPESTQRYRGEPYVVAADVSAAEGRAGASGWTWYTGSAGWMYRIWLEDILGFRLNGNELRIQPIIPRNWPGFELRYRFRTAYYVIRVERGPTAAVLDGQPVPEARFTLKDDGREHRILVSVPKESLQKVTPPQAESREASSPIEALK
jgi:cellobiose phosphorylase